MASVMGRIHLDGTRKRDGMRDEADFPKVARTTLVGWSYPIIRGDKEKGGFPLLGKEETRAKGEGDRRPTRIGFSGKI